MGRWIGWLVTTCLVVLSLSPSRASGGMLYAVNFDFQGIGQPMTSNTLICPFLNSDPVYAHGVEFGLLYARMRDSDEPVADYFTRENQDQILLLANRLGWSVVEVRAWDKTWFWCRMEKALAPE